MPRPPITILDIAASLGISKTAVSAALSGTGRVSATTRERVLAEADRLGYVTNRAAQRLRGGEHGAIGLRVPTDLQSLAFYMEFAFGVADFAAEAGRDLVLFTGDPHRSSRELPVDGLLVLDPVRDDPFAVLATSAKLPWVSVGPYTGAGAEGLAGSIAVDHHALTQRVLDRLQRSGSGRPALVAIDPARAPLWGAQVLSGYADWCATHAVAPLVLDCAVEPSDARLQELVGAVASDGDHDAVVWVAQGLAARALALADRDTPADDSRTLRMATLAGDLRAESGVADLVSADLRPRAYGHAAAEVLERALSGGPERLDHVTHRAEIVGPLGHGH
ncbi:LacI family DNA-binding transcriptional regulator [Leucobacter tardus]|uniref:LacI family DNA-binding transcriptional regulator n=1 Tax=Leucobacter tardus TaxID=501483 RepID=A0A939QDJ2_9MICO|nr:LacI family DNA-binding transcriptional regulator [Leucobacter tardus]MBO2989178.1 LacI family DNA-binding transcriptional regulator [Leucobacter tardus]